jgi:tripartite-type tricarboxylate transporter receptor subunit TctC
MQGVHAISGAGAVANRNNACALTKGINHELLRFQPPPSASSSSASAQNYPTKPVHLIVPYPAGGGTDFFARLAGQKMSELIGQPIVVENKPVAATNLGADFVAKAPPDGYTMLLGDVATYAANPTLYKKLPFDPAKDFAPVTLTARFLSVLVTNPNKLKVNSVAELIDQAKREPGKIDIAHAGVGNPFHLASVLFQQAAGIKLNEVPYRGAGPAVQGLLGGDVHMMFVDYATARSHIAAGTLKPLGVAALTRGRLAGFEAWPWQGFVVPAKTPDAVIGAQPCEGERRWRRTLAKLTPRDGRPHAQGSSQMGRGDPHRQHPARLISALREREAAGRTITTSHHPQLGAWAPALLKRESRQGSLPRATWVRLEAIFRPLSSRSWPMPMRTTRPNRGAGSYHQRTLNWGVIAYRSRPIGAQFPIRGLTS